MRNYKGSIAITFVMVVMAILLTTGLSLTLKTIQVGRGSQNYTIRKANERNLRTCLEESVNKLKYQVNYVGTYNLTVSNSSISCTITVSDIDTSNKSLVIQSTFNDATLDRTYQINVSQYPFEIVSVNN